MKAAAKARFWNANLVVDATGAGGAGGQRTAADSYVLVYKAAFRQLKEFYFSGNNRQTNKYELVTSMMLQTEQKKIKIPKKFRLLIDQLRAYRVVVKPSFITFEPSQGQDDGVSSLLMNAWYLKKGWILRGVPPDEFK